MFGSLWNEYFGSHDSVDSSFPDSVNPNIRNSLNPSFRGSKARYYAVAWPAVESFPFDPNEADSTQLLRLGLTPAQVRSIYRHRAKGYVYSTPEDFARTPFMTKGQWNHLKPLIKIGDQYKPVNLSSTVNGQCSTATVSRSVRSENQDSTLHSSLFVLHLNDDGFKTLLRHPFLSYEQVKAVKNFQRKYGRIRNMTELLILPEFTVEDTLRLSPYLQF
ncbi:MAG: hypothetical protein IKI44_01985 [Bacteroidaceae bacterium]|nr:hypothetical protein [Bacteroidaceae bacterium]